jgi:predicted TIM-barrel fold metal-dependent hydrolase
MAAGFSRRTMLAGLATALGAAPRRAAAAAYAGPLIDAHSHLGSPQAVEALVAAMARHDVRRVVLLGVGGAQPDDPAWLSAATRRYPDRVLAGQPLPDPTDPGAAARLDAALERSGARVVGEVHLRQVGRRTIDRDPASPAFGQVLAVCARRGVPLVIHYELTDAAAAALERALAAHPRAPVVLAHAGEGPPARVAGLLGRHPNLLIDLSGMHFLRKPALATEAGPLDPAWKALVEAHPDRCLMGLDVWAPRLLDPAMLDRLFRWTRRVLGELAPAVAARVAHDTAAALFRLA